MNYKNSILSKNNNNFKYNDRFIPNRNAVNVEVKQLSLNKKEKQSINSTTFAKEEYKSVLFSTLFNRGSPLFNEQGYTLSGSQIFKKSEFNPTNELYNPITRSQSLQYIKKFHDNRQILQNPERVLDLPEIEDNYYLKLLDWSVKNVVAIALKSTIYLFNYNNDKCDFIKTDYDDVVTSVSFDKDGNTLAVGTNVNHDILIWDVCTQRLIRTLSGHTQRSGVSHWNPQNPYVLASGSQDCFILNHDIRQRTNITSVLSGHSQEVCGLKWSPSGNFLASGGNDNLLNIWDLQRPNRLRFSSSQHQAAVRAIDWCTFKPNLLASGGGSSDRTIKIWDSSIDSCINTINTGSQVCALLWSKNSKELISSHGHNEYQLILWKYPAMIKIKELKRHNKR
jgi:cell division cycle protein 20 (cofactor of APC complex)